MTYKIYTDGSCYPNHKPINKGGYGFIVIDENEKLVYQYVQKDTNTTNNRMELKAVIAAINTIIERKATATIYTDSKYVEQGYNTWMYNWHRNHFTRKGVPIANKDLWLQLWALKGKAKIEWVKGHSDNPHNNLIDSLVNYAAEIPPNAKYYN